EEEEDEEEEEEPLIHAAECRICQEEDSIKNLETPCACSGSLKYAHRKCVQHWCNEKGDIICEICHQPYQPGYTAPPRPHTEETAIDIGGGWTISGTPLDLRDPRLLAIAEAERQFLEAEYDEYAASNASGAAFCRSAALILMALLLLRHALTVPDADGDDDVSTFFSCLVSCSFSCFELLDFSCHATSWLGPSVYYSAEGKDSRKQQRWPQHRLLLCYNLGNVGVCSLPLHQDQRRLHTRKVFDLRGIHEGLALTLCW
ncbi:RING/FYVE/PHD zinc finger superfamily protein isoform 4, partial [Theobroma cacao]